MSDLSFKYPLSARLRACFAQGARCGHIDGKRRCGQYVIGEEYAVTKEDLNQGPRYSMADMEYWADGYYSGYRVGADGEELPADIAHAELPENAK